MGRGRGILHVTVARDIAILMALDLFINAMFPEGLPESLDRPVVNTESIRTSRLDTLVFLSPHTLRAPSTRSTDELRTSCRPRCKHCL